MNIPPQRSDLTIEYDDRMEIAPAFGYMLLVISTRDVPLGLPNKKVVFLFMMDFSVSNARFWEELAITAQ